jgi:signal transduction histidine kinase
MHEFQLEQVFHNLIGNAVRYRNSPPRIKIAATWPMAMCVFRTP